jgi:hypothetical protein
MDGSQIKKITVLIGSPRSSKPLSCSKIYGKFKGQIKLIASTFF